METRQTVDDGDYIRRSGIRSQDNAAFVQNDDKRCIGGVKLVDAVERSKAGSQFALSRCPGGRFFVSFHQSSRGQADGSNRSNHSKN